MHPIRVLTTRSGDQPSTDYAWNLVPLGMTVRNRRNVKDGKICDGIAKGMRGYRLPSAAGDDAVLAFETAHVEWQCGVGGRDFFWDIW